MLQVAEVAERDPERRGGGPRRRRPEADQLGLAWPAVPAVAERVVVTAGVRHELTHAGWKRAQVAKRRGHAPVGVRPRASEEMVRRHEAERPHPRAHLSILAADGRARTPRRAQHDLGTGPFNPAGWVPSRRGGGRPTGWSKRPA